MVIMNNLAAMNGNRMYNINNKKKASSAEKLSSGYKINRAADDAAGLSISEKMRRQIRGLSKGVKNAQDGISLCQVADGALAEVQDMLHRITELSVQAGNDTNTEQERQAIQEEVNQILKEIDSIGDNTTFNKQPVFRGSDTVIQNTDGTSASYGKLEFSDFKLSDVSLGETPLMSGENADMMHLQAVVDKNDSPLDGKTFNLIYGNGSTSNSSIRITDSSGTRVVNLEQMSVSAVQNDANGELSRTFTYGSGTVPTVKITQTVKIDSSQSQTEQNYIISYKFETSSDVSNLEFLFHADTAYNNNDRCEGYFINGSRVDESCVYGSSALTNSNVSISNVPESLSIIDIDNALPFSEKISFDPQEKPDSMSIGNYSRIDEWGYYNSLDTNLGVSTDREDLGFSLYYNLKDEIENVNNPGKASIEFKYGIVSTDQDNNLNNITINKDNSAAMEHSEDSSWWIQSGCNAGDGMHLVIGEMNAEYLGIERLDVTTSTYANHALDAVQKALEKVSGNRSNIGAQQNRLEHSIANGENIIENTTAAESRIRDADMAKEMLAFSSFNILQQASQSMLAQANQSTQGILSLLQ